MCTTCCSFQICWLRKSCAVTTILGLDKFLDFCFRFVPFASSLRLMCTRRGILSLADLGSWWTHQRRVYPYKKLDYATVAVARLYSIKLPAACVDSYAHHHIFGLLHNISGSLVTAIILFSARFRHDFSSTSSRAVPFLTKEEDVPGCV